MTEDVKQLTEKKLSAKNFPIYDNLTVERRKNHKLYNKNCVREIRTLNFFLLIINVKKEEFCGTVYT